MSRPVPENIPRKLKGKYKPHQGKRETERRRVFAMHTAISAWRLSFGKDKRDALHQAGRTSTNQ